VYSERTQHVLIQESVGILDMEPPCTKHILAQYRGVCPQCDTLETPVIALSGSEEGAQGIAQGIERNNIRGRDSGHGRCCEEGKRGNGYW
jgi:hypothetical protein